MKAGWFYLLPLPLMATSLFVGPSDQVTWRHVTQWFWQKGAFWGAVGSVDPLVEAVLLDIRLPRVILTFLVGLPWRFPAMPFRPCSEIHWFPRTSWASLRERPSVPPWP